MTTALTVQYFALLQDEAGMTQESITASSDQAQPTPLSVYEQLASRHGFSLKPSALGYAVNDAFVTADHPLKDGDRLAFIPPVAGG